MIQGEQLLSCLRPYAEHHLSACQLCLAQEALTASLAVLFDVSARIRAVGPEAVLLRPIEKLRKQRQRPIGLIGLLGNS